MEQTIAQFFNWDFSRGDFKLYDDKNRLIYAESSDGSSWSYKYYKDGYRIHLKYIDGRYTKAEYDKDGYNTYYEDSKGNKSGISRNSKKNHL